MVIIKVVEFQAHVQKVTRDHFEVVYDAEYISRFHNNEAAQYASYFWTNESPINLSDEQTYLKSLFDLIAPVLETDVLYRKVARVRPKIEVWRASDRLVRPCRGIAHEAYNFSERLKLYWNSAKVLCVKQESRRALDERLSKHIRTFKKRHREVFAYRNYLVHSGAKIIDPFRDLSSLELAAIVGHPDLWFEFQNFFEEAKDSWKLRVKTLRSDMLLSLSTVQSLNEAILNSGGFKFAERRPLANQSPE